MLLNKDQILTAEDLPFRDIEVPEWGGTVRVRTMTAAEGTEFMEIIEAKAGEKGAQQFLREKLLVMTLVDEKGARIFSMDDIAALRGKSPAILNKLFAESAGINGMKTAEGEDAVEKK